jgi:hypothetical protein
MLVAVIGGCATIPDLPPEGLSLPTKQIILHAVCELRTALQHMQDNPQVDNAKFDATNWAIGLTLTPKTDLEASYRAGLTGKSSSVSPKFFNSWAVGSGPGAEYDSHGSRIATAKYALSSAKLLQKKPAPRSKDFFYEINCDETSPGYHALTENLGIQAWLKQAATASGSDLKVLTSLDNPTFTAEIIVKFDGAGSFTYTFPFGTDFLGMMGSYFIDEKLEIALTRIPVAPDYKNARLLPVNGAANLIGPAVSFTTTTSPSGLSPEAKLKLENLQLEQVLRNLQITPSRR